MIQPLVNSSDALDIVDKVPKTEGIKNRATSNRSEWNKMVQWHEKKLMQWQYKKITSSKEQARLNEALSLAFKTSAPTQREPAVLVQWEQWVHEYERFVQKSAHMDQDERQKQQRTWAKKWMDLLQAPVSDEVKDGLKKIDLCHYMNEHFMGHTKVKEQDRWRYEQALGLNKFAAERMHTLMPLARVCAHAKDLLPIYEREGRKSLLWLVLQHNPTMLGTLLDLQVESMYDKEPIDWLQAPDYWLIEDPKNQDKWWQLENLKGRSVVQGLTEIAQKRVHETWIQNIKEVQNVAAQVSREHVGSFIHISMNAYLDQIEQLCVLCSLPGAAHNTLAQQGYEERVFENKNRNRAHKRYRTDSIVRPIHTLMCSEYILDRMGECIKVFLEALEQSAQYQRGYALDIQEHYVRWSQQTIHRIEGLERHIANAAAHYTRELAQLGRVTQLQALTHFGYTDLVYVNTNSALWSCLGHGALKQLPEFKQRVWIERLSNHLSFTQQEMQSLSVGQQSESSLGQINALFKKTYVSSEQWKQIQSIVPMIQSLMEMRTLDQALKKVQKEGSGTPVLESAHPVVKAQRL